MTGQKPTNDTISFLEISLMKSFIRCWMTFVPTHYFVLLLADLHFDIASHYQNFFSIFFSLWVCSTESDEVFLLIFLHFDLHVQLRNHQLYLIGQMANSWVINSKKNNSKTNLVKVLCLTNFYIIMVPKNGYWTSVRSLVNMTSSLRHDDIMIWIHEKFTK